MSNLTPDELARLRLKAKHGMLTPEEQQAYDDYATEQLSAVSSPPSGAVPPKKGFKWESEKVAEWRLKARHDGLDENERLLYQDYQQTLALAEADANASDAKFTGESSERQLKKSAILRGVMSLALVVLIGMYVMTGCKLSESPFLVQYTMYEINYRLTGELPDTNEVWSNYLDMTKSQAGVPLVAITGAWDLGSFLQNTHSSVARLELVGGVPDECFFDEVVSGLRGTSDMTEAHRHSLSPELQEIFQQAADEAKVEQREWLQTAADGMLDEMEAAGCTIVRDVDTAAFQEAAAPVYEEYRDIIGSDLLDRALESLA